MDVRHRGLLRDHHMTIIDDLEPKDVLTQLLEDGTITGANIKTISSESEVYYALFLFFFVLLDHRRNLLGSYVAKSVIHISFILVFGHFKVFFKIFWRK